MLNQWVVEGTRVVSFRVAMMAAQLLADSQRMTVPVSREVRSESEVSEGELIIVKMVHPRTVKENGCRF